MTERTRARGKSDAVADERGADEKRPGWPHGFADARAATTVARTSPFKNRTWELSPMIPLSASEQVLPTSETAATVLLVGILMTAGWLWYLQR
ncbi:hypothetical protein C438_16885 [Haloferax denitrificans ATCC 35960]|nr:hypothetical protein C438_16885 [Haloferax denitrificans ATCC 35960]